MHETVKNLTVCVIVVLIVCTFIFCTTIAYLRNPSPDWIDTVGVLPTIFMVMHTQTLYTELDAWFARINRFFKR